MEIRSKEFAVRAELTEVSEADLELINRSFALRPLTAEQVYVRRIALCNDQYDRTQERFPRSYLERFAETLPGKPLLAHHDRHSYPVGRFFRAEVGTGDGARADGTPTDGIRAEGSGNWLYCWVYLVKTPANEEIRAQIDGGVYSHVSIGFRWADLRCDLCGKSYFRGDCPHVIGQEYEGRVATATYGGDLGRVEAVEGSLVYLGAQYGAVVTKSDDRQAEKECLNGCLNGKHPPKENAPASGLADDGTLYRIDLRREIGRLAACVRAEAEVAGRLTSLDAAGDVTASRLKELHDELQKRFDAVFPVSGIGGTASVGTELVPA